LGIFLQGAEIRRQTSIKKKVRGKKKMKFLVDWQVDQTKYPANQEEAGELLLSQLEDVKAALKAGSLKDWAGYVTGEGGYMVSEAASGIELYTLLRKWSPHIQFEVSEPTISVDQAIEITKKRVAALKK
jgi:hypothetical protein